MQETKDLQINRLIQSMNATGWLKTTSSSQGNAGYLYQNGGFVTFFCLASKLTDLCAVLTRIEQKSKDPVTLQLQIVHNIEFSNCQFFAPTGYISLHLEFGKARNYDQLFNLATTEFTNIFVRRGPQDSLG